VCAITKFQYFNTKAFSAILKNKLNYVSTGFFCNEKFFVK
jgi:hypothetical protein